VAQPKAQLSALLDAVERGEHVEITRRGVPVAQLVQPERSVSRAFDLVSFLAATKQKRLHAEADANAVVRELRDGARY
jgi:antitoxin (DNA-binding transcriptional repressor) of toxin-antitoxin stability system